MNTISLDYKQYTIKLSLQVKQFAEVFEQVSNRSVSKSMQFIFNYKQYTIKLSLHVKQFAKVIEQTKIDL